MNERQLLAREAHGNKRVKLSFGSAGAGERG